MTRRGSRRRTSSGSPPTRPLRRDFSTRRLGGAFPPVTAWSRIPPGTATLTSRRGGLAGPIMSNTQSGTIDGIAYASTQYVYDTQGDGFVTDILYFNKSGQQVADRTVFADPPFATSAPMANSDGTFSVKVTPPPGGGGTDPTYLLETFSSAGIWIREDDYGPVYKDPNNPAAGISGYTETGHSVV